jgi:tyrosyl-tRNA synthetase
MHPKEAKEALAFEITKQYCGQEKAQSAKDEFNKIFAKKDLPDVLEEFKAQDGQKLSDILFQSGLVSSKNEARRLFEQGGIKINGEKVASDTEIKGKKDFVLQAGKRKFKKIIA